jgi:hypothetical protein
MQIATIVTLNAYQGIIDFQSAYLHPDLSLLSGFLN